MKELENRILSEGIIINNDIIKVDSFINHQIDTVLAKQIGKFFASKFDKVDKVLTIESSGIVFAMATAEALGNVPFVFAKKNKSQIIDPNLSYGAIVHSFTKGIDSLVTVNKNYIKPGENVLIVDDFLANGSAGSGLVDICNQAKANVVGFCTVIEKSFQPGRNILEAKGIKVVAAARIKEFKNNVPIFVED